MQKMVRDGTVHVVTTTRSLLVWTPESLPQVTLIRISLENVYTALCQA